MPQEWLAAFSMIGTLILIVAIFVGAYFISKVVGRTYQNSNTAQAGNIEVIAQKALGKEQSLLIVKVAGKVFFLSATPHHINKIDELNPELLSFQEDSTPPSGNFLELFKGIVKSKHSAQAEEDTHDTGN